MVTCELMGGLGNQLFQISTSISLSISNNDNSCFDIDGHRIGLQGRNATSYKENIFRKLINSKVVSRNIFNENGHHYQKIDYKEDLKIVGYFQSEKYFIEHRSEILNTFEPSDENLKYIQEKYGSILSENTCSLHIRHGDYVNFKTHHPPCSVQYYDEAITHFPNHKFLIFSDDIEWCKQKFKGDEFIYIESEEDYIDLYLMSLCQNNIIANSTFSWWGSWLNKNENKKIIAPSKWFGSSLSHLNTEDIYTNKMIKI